ncbi:hypothetical protein E4U39_007432 [Claviceps sp. Clav50 group G5]|nr:hypothetical protein E4U39_007432 [Claviceps sp. Clav50 group G5]
MSVNVNGSGKPRFEIPVLDLDFGCITDGTNIPPPLESPKVPTPPQTPPSTKISVDLTRPTVENGVGKEVVQETKETQTDDFPSTIGTFPGIQRTADEAPLSPAGSARQGSIRRLFSKNMLNVNYEDVSSNSFDIGSRPQSRGTSSVMGGRKSKRNSWFKFFRSGEPKRASMFLENNTSTTLQKQVGPPPPMIPELGDLEKDKGSLGNDLFKNIKA